MNKATPHKVDPTAAVSEAPDPLKTAAAYEKYLAAALKLRPGELSSANVNVTVAAGLAAAGAQSLLRHREEADVLAKKVPWAVVERVEEVAFAARHADLLARLQEDETAAFADIYPRMVELRGILLDDLDLLVRRKLVLPKVVADIRKGDNTVRDKANDLIDAAQHYTANWDTVVPRTTVSREEIAEAEELATKALARLAAMQVAQEPKEGEPGATEMRRRMFTLLDHDYDVVRRYGAFTLWALPGGWEAYVPSLWSGRVRSAAPTAAEPTPTEPTPTEPAVLPGNKPG